MDLLQLNGTLGASRRTKLRLYLLAHVLLLQFCLCATGLSFKQQEADELDQLYLSVLCVGGMYGTII